MAKAKPSPRGMRQKKTAPPVQFGWFRECCGYRSLWSIFASLACFRAHDDYLRRRGSAKKERARLRSGGNLPITT